jgi:hypothetical protein
MSGVFVEDPWTRIVGGRRRKKKTEPPDDGGFGVPYCGVYGWGAVCVEEQPLRLGAFGPHQYPPMIGTFKPYGNVGPDGRQYGGIAGSSLAVPVDYLTAKTQGLSVINLTYTASSIAFGTDDLTELIDVTGNKGRIVWEVPMIGGGTREGALVIKGYTINVSWAFPRDEAIQFGIGVAHEYNGRLGMPPEPAVVLGGASGDGTFYYDFQWAKWITNQIVITQSNQFDPSIGGPVTLWWLGRNLDDDHPAWSGTYWFINPRIHGDSYTWEVVADCQTMPRLFV